MYNMFSIDTLWDTDFTSFIDFDEGIVFVVESFYDELMFNDDKTAFIRISDKYFADYCPLEKPIEVEIYKIHIYCTHRHRHFES